MSKKPVSLRLLRRTAVLFALRVCLALVTIVFAASISVTPTTYQSEVGSYVNVNNNLVATDRGFSFATTPSSAAGTSCASPIQFGSSPTTANTAITANHWVFTVQANSTTSIVANANFTVSLTVASTNEGSLCIEGASTPANNDTITCKFDIGPTLPTSPYTFELTIQ
jgi:hypothetical protein